jgi:hypothetical protein
LGDIFREIDEELRQERAEKLWRKYGKFAIAGVVAIVVLVASVNGWFAYQKSQREAEGARFETAMTMVAEGKDADAEALLAAIGAEAGSGYGVLARFHEAALRAKAGDSAAAAALYERIAADAALDSPLRDAATVLSALHAFNANKTKSADLIARLQPLVESNSPWRFSALELMGLVAHRSGDTAAAREYLTRISDAADAPSGIRARAAQILAVLGN